MTGSRRAVLDTSVVLSGLLFPGSVCSGALLAAQSGLVLASDATLLELVEVMAWSRFDRYLEPAVRQALVAEYINVCVTIPIIYPIRACRDPKDDKFLEVAVHGHADLIITGDRDLLDLHPFRGIAILPPAQYLARG